MTDTAHSAEQLCLSCMAGALGENKICSVCGTVESEIPVSPKHLVPRTVLREKYLIGKVIGEGGFGITYIGWDLEKSIKVAIKEYFPDGFVTRDNSITRTVMAFMADEESKTFFEKSKKQFIDEAQRLARFADKPGIVSVKDYFSENETAYIVMEYIEGETLKTVLAESGSKMPEAYVLEMVKPLLETLAEVHKAGIIHRDIAPDNIMVMPDGTIKLIDFGAAREMGGEKSMTVMLKRGFAPEEQYDSDSTRQGPWTDVYALCATIYRAIEGNPPPDAVDRLRGKSLAKFTVTVTENTRYVIMKGLSLFPKDRWQTVEELQHELFNPKPRNVADVETDPLTEVMIKPKTIVKNRNPVKYIGIALICITAIIAVVLGVRTISTNTDANLPAETLSSITELETNAAALNATFPQSTEMPVQIGEPEPPEREPEREPEPETTALKKSETIAIKGVEYEIDLTELDLSNQTLTTKDIEPLRYMTNLRSLSLYNTFLADISPIAGLVDLEKLYVDTTLKDLTPISSLTKLQTLFFSGEFLTSGAMDLTLLKNCVNLVEFQPCVIMPESIDILKNFKKLKKLHLHIRMGSRFFCKP